MGEGSLWKLKELSKQKEFEKAWGNNEKCKLDPEFSCISLAFLLPCRFHISSSWDPGRPLDVCVLFSVDSTTGLGVRRTLEQSHSFVLKEKGA